jgi:hypothetical protein
MNQILNYLGNNKFIAMTGAVVMSSGDRLIVKFKGSKVNVMEVTPNGKDLYNVKFAKQSGLKYNIVTEMCDIYGEMLKAVFERVTDLKTSL